MKAVFSGGSILQRLRQLLYFDGITGTYREADSNSGLRGDYCIPCTYFLFRIVSMDGSVVLVFIR